MSVYMPLDCDGFATALADYLEGDAPDAVRAAVEAHTAECVDCRRLLEDLGSIRSEAAALPALTPSRDLWSGIAERIDARVIPMGHPARTIAPARRTWARPAIAAAALVVVTAGITNYVTRAQFRETAVATATASATATTPESTVAAPQRVAITPPVPQSGDESSASTTAQPGAQRTSGASGSAASAPVARRMPSSAAATTSAARLASAEPVIREAEPVYDREIAKLRAIVTSRRSQLDPRTITVLEQSMAVIDSAIAQSRAALAKDPASGFLANQLNHSLEKKVELLRTAAMLPART